MTLHICRADDIKRTRLFCPYHKHRCYGKLHTYYDGVYMFFDCGTRMDSEGWTPPPKTKCRYCRKYFRPLEMVKHHREYHKINWAPQ